MTKISKANQHQCVYDCYMKGMRPETTAQHLRLAYKYVKNKYEDFILFSAKLKGNEKKQRIIQIRAIERELFTLMQKNPDDKRIDDLSYTYRTFLI